MSWFSSLLPKELTSALETISETVVSVVQAQATEGNSSAELEMSAAWRSLKPIYDDKHEAELRKKYILQLSESEGHFLQPVREEMSPHFPNKVGIEELDDKLTLVATSMLEIDSNLAAMRYNLVPKRISENRFWNNYFSRVYLIIDYIFDLFVKEKKSDEEIDVILKGKLSSWNIVEQATTINSQSKSLSRVLIDYETWSQDFSTMTQTAHSFRAILKNLNTQLETISVDSLAEEETKLDPLRNQLVDSKKRLANLLMEITINENHGVTNEKFEQEALKCNLFLQSVLQEYAEFIIAKKKKEIKSQPSKQDLSTETPQQQPQTNATTVQEETSNYDFVSDVYSELENEEEVRRQLRKELGIEEDDDE